MTFNEWVWALWFIAAVILFIAEILTPGFVLGCLGFACLVSSLLAFLKMGIKAQLAGFIAGAAIAFIGIKPLFKKALLRTSPDVKTNVDALLGERGVVTETIDSRLGTGRVLARGDDWKAVAADDQVIPKGSRVEVIKVEGIRLHVKPVTVPSTSSA